MRIAECPTGKVQHESANAARRVLAKVREEGHGGHREIDVYRCPVCWAWHVTHKRSRRTRRKRGS